MTSLAAGAVVAGRYRIVQKLGEGGMGAVYRAVQEPLGREVALKVISPALAVDQDAVARFHREARASSSLAHPNIVTVFDFGSDSSSNQLFLAMELLKGAPLDELVAKGPTPPARAITILRGIAQALAEAHGKGIVHRDLKPQNVMLTSTTTQADIAKVVDFGIAKMKDGGKTLTMTGAVVGTPGYVAPELFDGKEPSPQSDLYALGVVAFELLCGQAPFPGKTPMELIKAALFTDPLPMRAFVNVKELPAGFEPLVRALLEKDPQKRPASAALVDQQLQALQAAGAPAAANDLAPDASTEMALEAVAPPPAPPPSPVVTAATPIQIERPAQPQQKKSSAGPLLAAVGVVGILFFLAVALLVPVAIKAMKREPPEVPVLAGPEDTRVEDELPVAPPPQQPKEKKKEKQKPPASPPAPAGKGLVNINAIPWANVTIGGQLYGSTPLVLELASGTHSVQLAYEGKTVTRKLVVKPGEMASLSVDLSQ